MSQAISSRPELNGGTNQIELLPVQPWNFTIPLNASVIHAHTLAASKIAFISLEITVAAGQLNQILRLWSAGVSCGFVNGANTDISPRNTCDRHGFRSSQFPSHANECRWPRHPGGPFCRANWFDMSVEYLRNLGLGETCESTLETCANDALWLNFALQTGFLALSDTNVQFGQSAIEEVPTIALHQHLFPLDSGAILVKTPDSGLYTSGWDTTWYAYCSLSVPCSDTNIFQ